MVSDDATVGIYNFAKGSDFVHYAQSMIEQDMHVNGEFYVAPVYTFMVQAGKTIDIYNIKGMYGLGTPEDLDTFLSSPLAKEI